MDKTDKNTIEELLPRYCEGLATEEERLQVETWMDESEENRRMAKQIPAAPETGTSFSAISFRTP